MFACLLMRVQICVEAMAQSMLEVWWGQAKRNIEAQRITKAIPRGPSLSFYHTIRCPEALFY